ncbi:MAG: HAD-IA family hydrolase [Nitrospinae bacterium]|nr:HAD-IA family hydrolase [Nitrospinota bacterium]
MGQMVSQKPLELLIFDFDGTLIDSKDDIATSVNLTLGDLGLPLRSPEEIFSFVGDGVKRLLRLSVGEENLALYEEALRIFRRHYLSHCLDTTRFYPGMDRVIETLSGVKKAIATNKSMEYTLAIVEGLGLRSHFAAIESPADSSELKPDPGMLLRILSTLKISPEGAVLVGDSTNDVRAAKAAGIRACAVGYGYGDREKVTALEPDFYCEKPEELISLFGNS